MKSNPVLFLTRKIAAVQPGQEQELDAIEAELDDWLRLNHAMHHRDHLRRWLAERRAYLAERRR